MPPARRRGSAAPRVSRLSASTASASASALTSAAVARASVRGAGDAAHRLGAASAPRSRRGCTPSAIDGDRGVLLLDRGRDASTAMRRHFLDDGVDLLDRLRGVAGGGLDRADLAGDLLGRLGGLAGERFHLRGDDREAAAGLAGARRLDGGVEREQVGLAGDRLDQPDHLADAGRGVAELRHGPRRCAAPRRPRGSATSVDSAACSAISPIEAASSSTELAAAVTLLGGGADPLLGRARFAPTPRRRRC